MPSAYSDVAHLLRRAGFGGLPNEISAFTQFDLATVVDKVFDTTGVPAVTAPAKTLDSTATWGERYNALLQWWFDRMATTPVPIAEKMVIFWHGHFTSSLDKTDFTNMWTQLDMFRTLRPRQLP